MQVVIRMDDAVRLSEVVDAVETSFGFAPDLETTEDHPEMCVASYQTCPDGDANLLAREAELIVGALLAEIEDHGLANSDSTCQWNVQIS